MEEFETNIEADEITIGLGVKIEKTAVIRGVDGKAKKIEIGDNTYIGHNVQIICDEFKIGDYCKIHHDTNIHGYKPCIIGHNAWIGQFSIIDSNGRTTIGDNCGLGAHSQLWSHIKFGDTLHGCRFNSNHPLIIGDDVWFAGHCIVSPIRAYNKSMAMAGCVITEDMKENTVYAGVPGREVSSKIGNQFQEVSLDRKISMMENYLEASGSKHNSIKLVIDRSEIIESNSVSYFNIAERKYTKKGTEAEIAFMKFLLPEKAKFTPY